MILAIHPERPPVPPPFPDIFVDQHGHENAIASQ